LAAKGLGAKEWNNSLKTKLSLLPKKLFRIRMSRNFGMKMLTMTNLSTECLIQLTKLGYDATPFNQILKQNAKREMRLRLGKVRMQGVEFDNGDMYVDGHKAASDVRDEFVSVTEKLMDELAQCYNVLPQLDINNTIDHRPEGDEKWFLENEKTVTQFCRKLAAERPLKD